MLTQVVAETLQGIVLVYIDIGILPLSEEFDLLTEPEVCMVLPDKGVLPLTDQVLDLPVECLVRIPFPGGHPSDDGFFHH